MHKTIIQLFIFSVLIFSAPQNFVAREAVRESWASTTSIQGGETLLDTSCLRRLLKENLFYAAKKGHLY